MNRWLFKIKWIAGVALVAALVITTNLSDANNFARVKESLVTVYEDRVLAYDILFELNQHVHEQRLALATGAEVDAGEREAFIAETSALIDAYGATRLTYGERGAFSRLRQNVRDLQGAAVTSETERAAYAAALDRVEADLVALAEIQVREGRNQVLEADRVSENYDLFTRMEIIVIVVLAIGILGVILYEPKED